MSVASSFMLVRSAQVLHLTRQQTLDAAGAGMHVTYRFRNIPWFPRYDLVYELPLQPSISIILTIG